MQLFGQQSGSSPFFPWVPLSCCFHIIGDKACSLLFSCDTSAASVFADQPLKIPQWTFHWEHWPSPSFLTAALRSKRHSKFSVIIKALGQAGKLPVIHWVHVYLCLCFNFPWLNIPYPTKPYRTQTWKIYTADYHPHFLSKLLPAFLAARFIHIVTFVRSSSCFHKNARFSFASEAILSHSV